jgi:sugar phosphate isomerase/epimerase
VDSTFGRDCFIFLVRNMNRRDFLKLTGAVAIGSIGTTSCGNVMQGGASSRKWRMRLSTSSIHFRQLPIEQVCEKIAGLGYEAIDIWSAHDNCPHLDDVLNRLGADGLREVLDNNKLKLFSFSVYKGGYEKYAELLGQVGGGVAVRGSARPCKPEELSGKMKEFHESLKPLADLAQRYNSYLAIENHGGALLDSLDSFKAFVDTNKSPRIGIALAPYHLQIIKASVPEAIRICGEQLLFFYAWQHYPGSKQLPGLGPTDMAPWIKALADIRYRGYVNPFMHGHPEVEVMSGNLATSGDYIRGCYERVRDKI